MNPLSRAARPPTRPSQGRAINLGQKIAFGVGGFSELFGQNAVKNLSGVIYNITLHVNPALVGLVLTLSRVWDAFIAPLIGRITDNAHTRWGARRPLIFIGAILTGLAFPLVWLANDTWSEQAKFIYFVVTTFVFFAAYSTFSVPYNALSYELTDDYHERTRVMAYRSLFGMIAVICMQWIIPAAQWSIFDDLSTGLIYVCGAVGVATALTGVLPAIFVSEHTEVRPQNQPKIKIWPAIKSSARNRPMLLVLGITVFAVVANNMVNTLGTYLTIYYTYDGQLKEAMIFQGWRTTFSSLLGLAAIPIITSISSRFGKVRAVGVCLAFITLASIAKWFCFIPRHPYLQFIAVGLLAPAQSGLAIMLPSMVADVCDWDQLASGLHRSGILGAVYQWVYKFGLSITFLVSGLILVAIGFDEALGAAQTASTILYMRILFSAVPLVCAVISFFFLHLYPLSESAMDSIHLELGRKHAQ